jgi:hypothetical protein
MSDVSQGEGWWTAEVGKWYPRHVRPMLAATLQVKGTSGPPDSPGTPPRAGAEDKSPSTPLVVPAVGAWRTCTEESSSIGVAK